MARIFDTYDEGEEFDQFIDECKVPEGFIIVAASQDECVTNLSGKGKQWFADMGSKEIWNLEYR